MLFKHYKSLIGAAVALVVASGCGGGGGETILPPADREAPMVEGVQVTRAAQSDTVIVRARVYDNQRGEVTVQVQAFTGQQDSVTMRMEREFTDQYRAELPSNTVRVRVRAQDSAGNSRESDEYLVPPPNPPAM